MAVTQTPASLAAIDVAHKLIDHATKLIVSARTIDATIAGRKLAIEQMLAGLSITHRWIGTRLDLLGPDGEYIEGPDLRGLRGLTGLKGDKGDKGDQGERGPVWTLKGSWNSSDGFLDKDAVTHSNKLWLALRDNVNVEPSDENSDDWSVLLAPTVTDAEGVDLSTIEVVGVDTEQALTNKEIDASENTIANLATSMFAAGVVDADGTLSSNSDTKLATQKAVKAYADQLLAANDALVYKGDIDCSANPNYPAANCGWQYRVSVTGKIGGASGVNVEVGDLLTCKSDSAPAGNQATVGSLWSITQTNIDGAVVGPSSSVNGNIPAFSGLSGKVIQDSGKSLPTGTIVGTSDAQELTNKTVPTADAEDSSDAIASTEFVRNYRFPSIIGQTYRSSADRAGDTVHIFEFIPREYQFAILNGYSTQDVADYFDEAIAKAAETGGTVYIPRGRYCVSRPIVLPDTAWNKPVLLQGEGKIATYILATGDFEEGRAVIERGDAAIVIGGGIRNIWVDAAKCADYTTNFKAGKGTIIESIIATNARVTEGIFGSETSPRFYETKFIDAWFYTASGYAAEDRPDYNFRLIGYASDNEVITVHCSNAKIANGRNDGYGNKFLGFHPFGYPSTHEADYCLMMMAPGRAIANYLDGFTIAGLYVGASGVCALGNQFNWPATTTGDAILVATGLSNLYIDGSVYVNKPSARKRVAFEGTLPTDSYINDGAFGADGTHLLLGGTASTAGLSHAKLQIVGTTFADAHAGIGMYANNAASGYFTFFKSRGTVGSNGLVQNNDDIAVHDYCVSDGAAKRSAARIVASVDGVAAAGDTPGRIDIQTTPPGSTTPVRRMRVDAKGNVSVGAANLATTATDGFFYAPTTTGTPTGVPTAKTGSIPMQFDTSSNKLWAYIGGSWKSATFS